MAKKFKKQKQAYDGFVYILKIWLDTGVIFKIGTTNRSPTVRMLEIAKEFNDILGHIPKMLVLRERQTKDNYQIEADLLKQTTKYRYGMQCGRDMCGESELRRMEENLLLVEYEKCLGKGYPAKEHFKIEM